MCHCFPYHCQTRGERLPSPSPSPLNSQIRVWHVYNQSILFFSTPFYYWPLLTIINKSPKQTLKSNDQKGFQYKSIKRKLSSSTQISPNGQCIGLMNTNWIWLTWSNRREIIGSYILSIIWWHWIMIRVSRSSTRVCFWLIFWRNNRSLSLSLKSKHLIKLLIINCFEHKSS